MRLEDAGSVTGFSPPYKRYALGMMTAVYGLNLVDRNLMTLLMQPIKDELRLSDTQLGFLTGIAFAFFYATVGVPIGRLADRIDRSAITSVAIGLWGLTVMACLFVTSYPQMIFARIAAAVGEAGCKPPTYSLVGDYFPEPAERTRAMAIYVAGAPVAALISFAVGGWINEIYGWRVTFFLMGIPGLVLAVLVRLTIIDPQARTRKASFNENRLPSVRAVLVTLWDHQSLRHLSIALILLYATGFGLSPWYAAFLVRNHGMSSMETGMWLGVVISVAGAAGVILGGYASAHWFADSEQRQMRLSAVSVALIIPCFLAFLTLPNKYEALIGLMGVVIFIYVSFGPTYALMQRLVRDDMRATTMALVLLLVNLIGMGLGPQIVGILSDALRPVAATDSLRFAMMIWSLTALWSAYHFWRVGRTVQQDLLVMAEGRVPDVLSKTRVKVGVVPSN